MLDRDRRAFEFLYARQVGLIELSRDRRRQDREFLPIDAALERVDEFSYFGVAPRKRARGRDCDVVDEVWSLWVDIDAVDGERALSGLADFGLVPTIILCSGRGWWGHWKLAAPIPKAEVADLNRGLARFLSAAVPVDSCHAVSHTARLPGVVHEQTGVVSVVTQFSGTAYLPEAVRSIVALDHHTLDPCPLVVADARRARVAASPLVGLAASVRPADLGGFFDRYVSASPTRAEAKSRVPPIDRSAVEFAIAKELLKRGLSQEDVLEWFCHYQPPKHRERGSQTNSWTVALIASAAAALEGEAIVGSHVSPFVSVDRKVDQLGVGSYARIDRAVVLARLYEAGPVRYTDAVRLVEEVSGCSTSAAKKTIKLAVGYEYLAKTGRLYTVTPAAVRQFTRPSVTRGKEGIPWSAFLSSRPGRFLDHARRLRNEFASPGSPEEAVGPARRADHGRPEDRRSRPPKCTASRPESRPRPRTAHPSPHLDARRLHLERWRRISFEGTQREFFVEFFTPEHLLVSADPAYVQLYTGLESEPSYHTFLIKDDSDDPIGRRRAWRNRIGQRIVDPPLASDVTLGIARFLSPDAAGLAPLAAPVATGAQVLPSTGIIIEPRATFWHALFDAAAPGEYRGRVWRVSRSGRKGSHAFAFTDIGPAPQTPPDTTVHLDEVVERLTDPQRLHDIIDELPPTHCPYGPLVTPGWTG